MQPYQNIPPADGQQTGFPPPVSRAQPNPAYTREKRRLRQSANFFGISVILYFAVNIGAGVLLNFLLQLMYQFTGRQPFGNSEVSYYLLNMGVYLLSFTIAFGAYLLLVRMPLRVAMPFRPVRAGTVLLSIPATFTLSIAGSILTSLLSVLFSVTGYQPVTNDVATPVTPAGLVLYFILLAVLPAVVEEIAFRGILMQSLRRFGDGFALLVSSLLFGMFHLNMVQAPYAFLLGLWFGYLVLRTGSLRISMILHACINFSAGVMSILMKGMGEETLVMVNMVYIVFWISTGVAAMLFLALRAHGPLRLYPAQTWMRTGRKLVVFFTSVAMIFALLAILFFTLRNFVRV